ncbi:LacI family DNA-binding transcriptional regulator [Nonomuraea thailandensis]
MPHAARPTVTLHDVAAAAGVSVATASRVLGGSSRKVAPEYEARVLAAAAALRYTMDASARAMRRAGDSIALVADDLTTPSMGMVVAAMEHEARDAGRSSRCRPPWPPPSGRRRPSACCGHCARARSCSRRAATSTTSGWRRNWPPTSARAAGS